MDSQLDAHYHLKTVRLIASDLDGTLLDASHSVSQSVLSAVRDLDSLASVPIYIATGRCRSSALAKFDAAGEDWSSRPGVFLNGAIAYGPKGKVIFEKKFEIEELEAILSEFSGDCHRAVVMPCSGDTIHAPQLSPISLHLHEVYADPRPIDHGSYCNMVTYIRKVNLGIHMISISTSDCRNTEEEVVARLHKVVRKFDNFEDYSIVSPIPRLVTVLPRNTSKGEAVLALCKSLSVEPKHVAAIGDSNNDICMLKMVGFGVAVGNAKDVVKKNAKLVVNRHDHPELPGVAHLAQLVLQSRINYCCYSTKEEFSLHEVI